MVHRVLTIVLLFVLAPNVAAAPELSEADRQRLADGTTDNDGVLDEQDGLYVLLRNASGWQGDDFSGEAGAAIAPQPDYDYIRTNPEKVRGQVFTVTGALALHDRYPSLDNHDRVALTRAGDPAWGDQLTRWTIATDPDDKASTVIVLFNDPRGQIKDPGLGKNIKAAARFYKLWTIKDVEGQLFTYPVFVSGAYEVVADSAGGTTGESPTRDLVVGVVLIGAVAFFVVRILLNRGSGGSLTEQRLAEMRMQREYDEEAEEEDKEVEDLPEDPADALDVLRERHDADGSGRV